MYFKGLLNQRRSFASLIIAPPVCGPIQLFTHDEYEVKRQLRKMQNGKTIGPDDLLIEALKALDDTGVKLCTDALNDVLLRGRIHDN